MPRRSRRSSRRSTRLAPSDTGADVTTQLEVAVRRPLSAVLGAVLGGSVPWFARALAHEELPDAWTAGSAVRVALLVAVVAGCAGFSMLTIYKFGAAAFADRRKAVGFVLALEGVMLVAHGQVSAVALALLVLLNAVANGCVIATRRDATLRRQEADARRVATRAANRAAASAASTPTATRAPAARPAPRAAAATTIPATRRLPARASEIVDAEVVGYTWS